MLCVYVCKRERERGVRCVCVRQVEYIVIMSSFCYLCIILSFLGSPASYYFSITDRNKMNLVCSQTMGTSISLTVNGKKTNIILSCHSISLSSQPSTYVFVEADSHKLWSKITSNNFEFGGRLLSRYQAVLWIFGATD